jgi:hypothetical protein
MAEKLKKQPPFLARLRPKVSSREALIGGVGVALGIALGAPLLVQREAPVRETVIRELNGGASSGVIARTALGRKETPAIIEVLDTPAESAEKPVPAPSATPQPPMAEGDLRQLHQVLVNLDAERDDLIESLKSLSQSAMGESMRLQHLMTLVNTLQGQVADLRQQQAQGSFGERLENLGLIFLGQQLVVLDNAFTRGDATPEAVRNVEAFARDVAGVPAVALPMAELAEQVQVGVITRLSLLSQVEAMLAAGEPVAKVPTPQDPRGSLLERIQTRAAQWVKVRKIEGTALTEGAWQAALRTVHTALAAGHDARALSLLNEPVLMQDERLNPLRAHVEGYLRQKDLLRTAQNAYYATYRP